jgi:hypothetical protein
MQDVPIALMLATLAERRDFEDKWLVAADRGR